MPWAPVPCPAKIRVSPEPSFQSFKVEDFNKMDIDMVLMSPPCQPFVRVGLQKDTQDKRTASFVYFLKILPL